MTISFRVKLLASHAVVALVVGMVTLIVVDRQVSRSMEHQIDQRLEAQARAVATWMERAAHPAQLARRLAGVVDARVTILDKHGIAVGESHAQANAKPAMDSEGVPPEVVAARDGKLGRETRFSAYEGQPVRYVAVAAPQDVVVRLGLPLGDINDTKDELRRQLIVGAVASLLLALGLAAIVAGPLTRRLREATAAARRIGSGDYAVPAPSQARDEIGVLSRALATAGAELAATEEKRRAFLANVAHEIRTPVTSIRGYAQILSGSHVEDDTRREFLQTIHRNAVRIGTLVEDLLELEALEAGKGAPLSRDAVVLAPIVKHVVDTLHARANEVGGTITTNVAADLAPPGDADAIERIVLNPADNALRHGGANVQVAIEARKQADRVIVTVTDSGPGIPDEHRAKIFDRFHRANPTQQGSGLGLAIARELAVAMGGSLVLGDRSTFTLELPA
ncbi:MAG TPA: HAMP domain-containing sensor histidine kinase [Kofleriaceae bacterium]